MFGSSPLARGLRSEATGRALEIGIIPARAGFTRTARRSHRRAWDHPRSRGVYPRGHAGLPGPARIIPARAGFTIVDRRPAVERGDHPRSRGVYEREIPTCARADGSSPLARGLRKATNWWENTIGIIPARAGFTRSLPSLCDDSRDHPRSRGVYRRPRIRGGCSGGSSPLARGLLIDG